MQCSVVSLERATVSLVRWMERHHEQSKVHPCPPAQPWREGPLVPAGAAIRTHAVRWGPWGCPAHGAIPDTTECSRDQGRGQAPVCRGVRCKAVGGDASHSRGDSALVRRRGLSIAITQRVRCGRLVERSTEKMSSTPIGRRRPLPVSWPGCSSTKDHSAQKRATSLKFQD